MRTARASRGFTLIEVLVAVGIMALMTAVTWASMSNSFHVKDSVEKSMDRVAMARLAIERLSHEVASAWIVPVATAIENRTFVTEFRIRSDAGGSRLDFVSFSHTRLVKDANESDQNELSYWVADDPEARGTLALWRREAAHIDDRPETGGKASVVVSDVVRFTAEALDPLASDEGDWLEEWDTTEATGHPDRLPRAVRLTLVFHDARGEDITYATIVRLFLEKPICGSPALELPSGLAIPTPP
ncbi:MAG TPA: type II secretion system protein GspJ [Myxococcota bacterium]|jgi:general secretion pathway protein J|nr:type II secretion system protein GspJ [Myxococcota bacterium]